MRSSHMQQMMVWHVATSWCSDPDLTAKIKEDVGPCREIVIHLLRETWQHHGRPKLLHWIGWSEYFAMKFSIKPCSLFSEHKFWLKHEEINHFWTKILSYSWFSCILDSILHQLMQVNHDLMHENVWIRPLNAKSMTKKEPEKFSAIKAIWWSIFTSIGLVVWFLHNLCNLESLD